MEADQVQPGPWHQRSQPLHELQRAHHQVRGAVAPGCLELALHLAGSVELYRIGDAETRIERALDEVGLGRGFRFRYPHQLSGGQRQRIAIARALILEPQVMLLDEPTSALDASVQAEVLNLLEELRRRRGLTFIMVSHDLAVVTHMCEKLMVMQRGQTVELLSSSDLAAHAVTQDYTRKLMEASSGFNRDTARA